MPQALEAGLLLWKQVCLLLTAHCTLASLLLWAFESLSRNNWGHLAGVLYDSFERYVLSSRCVPDTKPW